MGRKEKLMTMELRLPLPASKQCLDSGKFARMLEDPTQCYKFYCLDAILSVVRSGRSSVGFGELADKMICDAWHSVAIYRLRLGPTIRGETKNYLEQAVHVLESDPKLPRPTTEEILLEAIRRNSATLKPIREQLLRYVPYRLMAPFLGLPGNSKLWNSTAKLLEHWEATDRLSPLPYKIENAPGLRKQILIHPLWAEVLREYGPVIQD